MARITYAQLERAGACDRGLRRFREMFGNGGEITLGKCLQWADTTWPYSGPACVADCLGVRPLFNALTARADRYGMASALWEATQSIHAFGEMG
jgi:hypothetical protein